MTNTNTKPIDAWDGFSGVTAVFIDRDPPNTRDFLAILAGWDIESVKLPPRSPNLKAYAERSSARSKKVVRMIFFGEDGLRNAIREFVAH